MRLTRPWASHTHYPGGNKFEKRKKQYMRKNLKSELGSRMKGLKKKEQKSLNRSEEEIYRGSGYTEDNPKMKLNTLTGKMRIPQGSVSEEEENQENYKGEELGGTAPGKRREIIITSDDSDRPCTPVERAGSPVEVEGRKAKEESPPTLYKDETNLLNMERLTADVKMFMGGSLGHHKPGKLFLHPAKSQGEIAMTITPLGYDILTPSTDAHSPGGTKASGVVGVFKRSNYNNNNNNNNNYRCLRKLRLGWVSTSA